MALNLQSDKTFFFHRNKDLYLLFYPRLSLIRCCFFFFAFRLVFGIFVKWFWQLGDAKFRSWCDYKLAIIKPSTYWSTYCLLIKWLIFSCRVNLYGCSLLYFFKYGWDASYHTDAYIRERLLAKVNLTLQKYNKLRVASGLNFCWYGSMEWNLEEKFSMEWNMEGKIFSRNGNGMEENCRYGIWKNLVPFHSTHW